MKGCCRFSIFNVIMHGDLWTSLSLFTVTETLRAVRSVPFTVTETHCTVRSHPHKILLSLRFTAQFSLRCSEECALIGIHCSSLLNLVCVRVCMREDSGDKPTLTELCLFLSTSDFQHTFHNLVDNLKETVSIWHMNHHALPDASLPTSSPSTADAQPHSRCHIHFYRNKLNRSLLLSFTSQFTVTETYCSVRSLAQCSRWDSAQFPVTKTHCTVLIWQSVNWTWFALIWFPTFSS